MKIPPNPLCERGAGGIYTPSSTGIQFEEISPPFKPAPMWMFWSSAIERLQILPALISLSQFLLKRFQPGSGAGDFGSALLVKCRIG